MTGRVTRARAYRVTDASVSPRAYRKAKEAKPARVGPCETRGTERLVDRFRLVEHQRGQASQRDRPAVLAGVLQLAQEATAIALEEPGGGTPILLASKGDDADGVRLGLRARMRIGLGEGGISGIFLRAPSRDVRRQEGPGYTLRQGIQRNPTVGRTWPAARTQSGKGSSASSV